MAENLASLLEQKLKNLLNKPSGLLDCYSEPVKRRIRAVKKIQDEHDALQEAMETELRALEKKYDEIYHPLFESRSKLILGELEPDESDLVPLDDDSEKNPQDYEKVEQTLRPDGSDRGIPRYWSDALSNHKFIEMFITEEDLDALNYLDNIEIKRSDISDIENKKEADNEEKKQDVPETKKNGEVKALILHFGENPYFTNTVLTKVMTVVKVGVGESVQSEGVKINWKEGKNLGEINLVEVQVKKDKKKTKKSKKVKQEPKEVHIPHTFTKRTFFDLLINDEELGLRHKRMISEEKERKRTLLSIHKQKVKDKKKEKEDQDGDVDDEEDVDDDDMFDVDDEDEKIVYSDHKELETLKEVLSDASQIIIDEVFPQSYPWFTGEKALDDDDEDEEEEEELAGLDDEDDDDADDDDDDDDEDDDDDKKAKRKKGKKPKGKSAKKEKPEKKEGSGQKEVPPECKQQ